MFIKYWARKRVLLILAVSATLVVKIVSTGEKFLAVRLGKFFAYISTELVGP